MKGKYVRQTIYTYQGYIATTGNPDIDCTDEPVFQYNVPIIGNTLANARK